MTLALLVLLTAAPSATDAFTRLRTLTGEWEATLPDSAPDGGPPRTFRISYRLISRDTVLVETWGVAAPTMTLFHLDGKKLLATHYCAQGNQPRLKMTAVTPNSVVFEYQDATNLPSAEQSHLVRLELVLTDENHFVHKEVYAAGATKEPNELAFTRVPAR